MRRFLCCVTLFVFYCSLLIAVIKLMMDPYPNVKRSPTPGDDDEARSILYPIPSGMTTSASIDTRQYEEWHQEALADPDAFWLKHAHSLIDWQMNPTQGFKGDFTQGQISWFGDGRLNVAYNCVDRHAKKDPSKVAIWAEGDEPGHLRQVTYGELLKQTRQMAAFLRQQGIRPGDVVAIYMPMIPETVVAMLACARIGAPHLVIFAGFSAEAVADRLVDSGAKILFTADEGVRGGRRIALKNTVNVALEKMAQSANIIKRIVVYRRTGTESVKWNSERDIWWHTIMNMNEINNLKAEESKPAKPSATTIALSSSSNQMEPQQTFQQSTLHHTDDLEWVDSEHPLFMLYTSGSTGKPKGLVHTSGGYLLYTMFTHRHVFDYRKGDVYGCLADVGWITGHSYIVYGPLGNGAGTVLFEGTPLYPTFHRYWEIVRDLGLTQLYTAPTVIRALKRLDTSHAEREKDQKTDEATSITTPGSSNKLRVIGSVGEPIDPEAWKWYRERFGDGGKAAIVDTYWQTETGGHVIAPIPGAIPTKAGSATRPLWGIQAAILNEQTGQPLTGNQVEGVLAIGAPWPGMARTIYRDHTKFVQTYFQPYPGWYFSGDRAFRDQDGYYWIRGRVDDVINVSGHRLSTAEIESALTRHSSCAEAAVLGRADPITGQAIWAFCIPIHSQTATLSNSNLETELIQQVRTVIGGLATPKRVLIVDDLPKTRSGKIMRRIIRKVLEGVGRGADEQEIKQSLGDTSTLNNPAVIEELIRVVREADLPKKT